MDNVLKGLKKDYLSKNNESAMVVPYKYNVNSQFQEKTNVS